MALTATDAFADAALRCIARWGFAKTTLEDVAREAGSSRATVYRTFPGGKDALFAAVVARELQSLEAAVVVAVEASGDVEDALVAAVTTVARRIEDHAAFQFLLRHEPGVVLPHLAFHHLDGVLARARTVGGPLLERVLPSAPAAAEAAEWVARIVISYTSSPSAGVDLVDEGSVRRLLSSFVVPGLHLPVAA